MLILYNAENAAANLNYQYHKKALSHEVQVGIQIIAQSLNNLYTTMGSSDPSIYLKRVIQEEFPYDRFQNKYFPSIRKDGKKAGMVEAAEEIIHSLDILRNIFDKNATYYTQHFADRIPLPPEGQLREEFLQTMKTIVVGHIEELLIETQEALAKKVRVFTPLCCKPSPAPTQEAKPTSAEKRPLPEAGSSESPALWVERATKKLKDDKPEAVAAGQNASPETGSSEPPSLIAQASRIPKGKESEKSR